MKRREVLRRGAVLGAAPNMLWAASQGSRGDHNAYFSRLNALLKREGAGRPVMLVDLDRLDHNIKQVVTSVGPDKTYRAVVKSLPSVPLLDYVTRAARTQALMVFHQPFLNTIAQTMPASDVLLGKPMPVAAARTFYALHARNTQIPTNATNGKTPGFVPAQQLQWLIDSRERLLQYQQMARQLGLQLKVNLELDVGLRRGGFVDAGAVTSALQIIQADPAHLTLSGLMGYEAHLTGQKANLKHPGVQDVLARYRAAIDATRQLGFAQDKLTLNGAGSHTLRIYEQDRTMNDLSAGSGLLMPTDFDTHHLSDHLPALFIATPILKRYGDSQRVAGINDETRRLYYIYGGYWKARLESPPGVGKPLYESTNQSPITIAPDSVLDVDDYMFFRPTQSEFVMLQFGDLVTVRGGQLGEPWPVFHQTG